MSASSITLTLTQEDLGRLSDLVFLGVEHVRFVDGVDLGQSHPDVVEATAIADAVFDQLREQGVSV